MPSGRGRKHGVPYGVGPGFNPISGDDPLGIVRTRAGARVEQSALLAAPCDVHRSQPCASEVCAQPSARLVQSRSAAAAGRMFGCGKGGGRCCAGGAWAGLGRSINRAAKDARAPASSRHMRPKPPRSRSCAGSASSRRGCSVQAPVLRTPHWRPSGRTAFG